MENKRGKDGLNGILNTKRWEETIKNLECFSKYPDLPTLSEWPEIFIKTYRSLSHRFPRNTQESAFYKKTHRCFLSILLKFLLCFKLKQGYKFPGTVVRVMCKCATQTVNMRQGQSLWLVHSWSIFSSPTGFEYSHTEEEKVALLSNIISHSNKHIGKLKLTTFIFPLCLHALWGKNWKQICKASPRYFLPLRYT